MSAFYNKGKTALPLLMCLLLVGGLSAQNPWSDLPSSSRFPASAKKDRISHPADFRSVSFDATGFLNHTRDVLPRTAVADGGTVMSFPLPDGKSERFRLMDAELMHPDLAAKFPELKAYIGKGIDDPTADIRITYSPYHGFNGMIRSGKHSTVYIDPITKDHQNYMVYYRKDVTRPDEGFECHTIEPDGHLGHDHGDQHLSGSRYGDCNMRRYRLAQSCTGEYSQYHIAQAGGTTGSVAGDKAIVQSAMNVTMNRVNGVFENDMGITMQFIANNDLIIYLDGGTDPWSNEWNTTTAQTIDAQIGVANYDIGHNFNDTGGGNAGCLDCVCLSVSQSGTHKGRGYTGRSAPIGDPFDIDYVAHEMGHQFNAYHVQSSSGCRSGSGTTEVEPGSGSTIMGYAGICAANVQSNSDDYFAYVNIRDVVLTINSGNCSTCAELIPSGNSSPAADAGADYSIPVSTPFKLTGVGSDPNDSGLTYCWEQNDPEAPGTTAAPSPTRAQGPMFRSLDPVAVPYRYMPNLTDLVNNTSPTFEVIPSISRDMEFSFTVRDNNVNSGCTESDLMTVTTVAGAGPFLVTSPNTAVTWDVATTETITWDVAGTTAAPINCANVDILLSTDGGMTYPVTIASGTPNDGTQDITVPNNPGANTRIKVFCSDNIFFDISNQDFTIQAAFPGFLITAAPTEQDACVPNTVDYTITSSVFGGYADDVSLVATGLPAGMNASFAPVTITGGAGTSVMTLTTSGVATGTYTITIEGTGSTGTETTTVDVTVLSGVPGNVTLSSPANGSTNQVLTPSLSWAAATEAADYDIDIASDIDFSTIVESATGVTGTSYMVGSPLASFTVYYWRVRANNFCGTSAYSETFIFRTQNIGCTTYNSTDVPVNIGNNVNTKTSDLTINTSGIITDLNVVGLDITHSWINDLHIDLINPTATTTVRIMDRSCAGEDNFDLNLDDEAAPGAWPCPPVGGGTYQPSNALSAFDGEDYNGTWTLEVRDNEMQDGGSINGWGLEVCNAVPLACEAPLMIPSAPGTYTADMECTDGSGWTHYWKQAATAPATPTDVLLLSIQKDGTVSISPNQVTVGVTGAGGSIDLSGAAYVIDPVGWFVMNRYWDVNPTTQPGGGGVNVRFYYTTADYDGVAAAVAAAGGSVAAHSDLVFYKFQTGAGVNPDPSTGHTGGDATNYLEFAGAYTRYNLDHTAEFNVAGFSGGGGGAGGAGGGALPVELLQFSGEHLEGRWNDLDWATASEQNSKHFEVQYSLDGRDFESIGTVAAKGNTSETTTYGFQDPDYRTGDNYYRLKLVDMDGSFEYSNTINIRVVAKGGINVLPNPTTGEFNIIFNGMVSGEVVINVVDVAGRTVVMQNLEAKDLGTQQVSLAHLPNGVYLLRVEAEGQLYTAKVVKH